MNRFLRYWLPVFLFMGLIFYLSSLSSLPIDNIEPIKSGDPNRFIPHLIEYLVLGFLAYRALFKTETISKNLFILALMISILYGLSDEVHQLFVPGRFFSYLDLVADSAGSFIGIIAYRFGAQRGLNKATSDKKLNDKT